LSPLLSMPLAIVASALPPGVAVEEAAPDRVVLVYRPLIAGRAARVPALGAASLWLRLCFWLVLANAAVVAAPPVVWFACFALAIVMLEVAAAGYHRFVTIRFTLTSEHLFVTRTLLGLRWSRCIERAKMDRLRVVEHGLDTSAAPLVQLVACAPRAVLVVCGRGPICPSLATRLSMWSGAVIEGASHAMTPRPSKTSFGPQA
jgi:hypothetical protein